MAKFAVLFLAALAFQATFAGVHRHLVYQENTLGDYEYGQLQGYRTGELDNIFDQFQTVTKDLTVYFQRALPNDRLVVRTITYQSRELALYIDNVIDKLQFEANNCSGKINIVLQEIIRELREIQTGFLQVARYTQVYGVSQLKNEFYTCFQNTIVQVEKLMRLVQTDFEQTQGELHMIVKNVITDFMYAFHNIYTHVQYFGVYGEQSSPRKLAMQIEEITKGLTGYFQAFDYSQMQQFRYALREYVQYVEAIIYRLQEVEGTIGHLEIDTVFQQICNKLRRVLVPLMQFIEAENMENFDVVRSQLVKEFLFVAEEFEQLVQYAQTGSQQTFIYEVLGDYLYALHQFRYHMQSGYQGGFYGLYQGEFYGKTGFQGLYKYGGLLGQTGYQGLYKYGGLYDKTGYQGGLYGKYQGFNKYGLRELEIKMQTVVRDLCQTFETVYVDDVAVRQTMIHLICEYAQELEYIVDRLHQAVSYNADADMYVFQQYVQNLRQIVVAFHQMYTTETYSATEMRSQFCLYIQKFVTEFERLISGIQQTDGTFYYYVQNVLVQYLTVTYELHMKFQHITEIAQEYQVYGRQYYGGKYYGKYYGGKYGQYYGLQGRQFVDSPRELVNQIQYVASDLSATLQNSMVYNQQYAQVLSVRVREFAQIIKNIVDQLEGYEHVDTVIQQVIYKLRELQLHLQQLAAYNVFTNVHQLKAEFDSYIQIAVAQIEKLVLIAHEETQGDYYYVLKNMLNFFLSGLHDIHYQIQEVAQYGQFGQYGKGYGYGKYGQEYGFLKYGQKYGQGYGFGQQYGQGYGFGKYGQQYGQGYGYGKYGKGYGYGKYGQDYGFGKYGQEYGLQGLEHYGKGYGYGYQSTNAPFGKYFQTYQTAIRAY